MKRIGLFLSSILFFIPSLALAQTGPPSRENTALPEWAITAKVDTPDSTTSQQQFPVRVGTRLDAQSSPHIVTQIRRRNFGALPVDASDLIVVGTVSGFQPHLTGLHDQIYTTLTLNVASLVHSNLPQAVSSATIVQRGGAIKLSDGRVIKEPPVFGETPLQVGPTYLLFLHQRLGTGTYTVLKAWNLSGPNPIEIDMGGMPVSQSSQQYQSNADLIKAAGGAK